MRVAGSTCFDSIGVIDANGPDIADASPLLNDPTTNHSMADHASDERSSRPNDDPDLLVDSFGRRVTYLRLSVTDRCNFQCKYCMPGEGIEHAARPEQLTFDEIEHIVRLFARRGVRKVRLTGGEPLLRPDIEQLVDRLVGIESLDHVAMTTNAFLLDRHIDALERAGLTSINISLDTLDPEAFESMTQTGSLDRVVSGIRAAADASMSPVKLNTVVIRGFNDDELPSLVKFAADLGLPIRFIEFMPIGQNTIWSDDDTNIDDSEEASPAHRCLPAEAIRERLQTEWAMTPDDDDYGAGPASYWRVHGDDLPDSGHPIGVIGAVTECFCADCNRLRLTATGGLRACLADDRETSLRAPLRTQADSATADAELLDRIRHALGEKRQSHDFSLDGGGVTETAMTSLGG